MWNRDSENGHHFPPKNKKNGCTIFFKKERAHYQLPFAVAVMVCEERSVGGGGLGTKRWTTTPRLGRDRYTGGGMEVIEAWSHAGHGWPPPQI